MKDRSKRGNGSRARFRAPVAALIPIASIIFVSLGTIDSEPADALPSSVINAVRKAETSTPPQKQPQNQPHPVRKREQGYSNVQLAPTERMFETRIRHIGQSFNGDVGIAVKDVQTGFTAHFDGTSYFPQQSVSKFFVALTAFDKADRGEINLHAPVTVRHSDLTLFNQPIASLIGADGYRTSLAELIERAIQHSDNTANDFVLWRVGGPDAVRSFLSRKGINGIRFGPGERVMQSRIAGLEWKQSYSRNGGFYAARNAVPMSTRRAAFEAYVTDPVDGATPVGLVEVLACLRKGELLSHASTAQLIRIMSNTRTGPQRLKGGLAPGWSLAHKTGTGQILGSVQSGYNDIGIVTSPNGHSYAVAVMIRRTATPIPARMEMMQRVTRAIIDYARETNGYAVAARD